MSHWGTFSRKYLGDIGSLGKFKDIVESLSFKLSNMGINGCLLWNGRGGSVKVQRYVDANLELVTIKAGGCYLKEHFTGGFDEPRRTDDSGIVIADFGWSEIQYMVDGWYSYGGTLGFGESSRIGSISIGDPEYGEFAQYQLAFSWNGRKPELPWPVPLSALVKFKITGAASGVAHCYLSFGRRIFFVAGDPTLVIAAGYVLYNGSNGDAENVYYDMNNLPDGWMDSEGNVAVTLAQMGYTPEYLEVSPFFNTVRLDIRATSAIGAAALVSFDWDHISVCTN